MTIRSRPSSDDYRDGWDPVFGYTRLTREETDEVLAELASPAEDTPERRTLFGRMPLNPHDATEHPAAD